MSQTRHNMLAHAHCRYEPQLSLTPYSNTKTIHFIRHGCAAAAAFRTSGLLTATGRAQGCWRCGLLHMLLYMQCVGNRGTYLLPMLQGGLPQHRVCQQSGRLPDRPRVGPSARAGTPHVQARQRRCCCCLLVGVPPRGSGSAAVECPVICVPSLPVHGASSWLAAVLHPPLRRPDPDWLPL